MPELTIQIVGWNSARTLPETVAALKVIAPHEGVIRYIDNASHDNSVAIVRTHLPHAEIIELPENKGFAAAHNIGFSKCTTPYVAVHDPDVALNWPEVQKLLTEFNDDKVAAVQGKLLRVAKTKESFVIDSAGIVLTLTLNGHERGGGKKDTGQYESSADLIATTGAFCIYRVSALQATQHTPQEIYDEDFFSYKEDVDLGWRLRRAGWHVRYVPVPVGIHHRTLGGRGFLNWGFNPILIYRRLMSPRTRYSLRNWVWMMSKNAGVGLFLLHAPWIVSRLIFFFMLSLLYPPLTVVWLEIIRGLPKMLRRR